MTQAAAKQLAVPKRQLYGPGPASVDERAYAAMQLPVLGIRDPQFLEIVGEVRQGLRYVFGTRNAMTFPVPAGGSGAMEAAVANFVLPSSKFAVLAAGHFSDRITEMGRRYGANVAKFEKTWGEVFNRLEIEEFLDREKPNVVAFVQAETSTGAYQSGRDIVRAAKNVGALVIGDCVTSLGAMPVEIDEVGIDVAFSCTQKGLSCPAGLAPITVSPAAWERLSARKEDPGSWYFDLRLMAKYFEPPHVYQHTPSPPLYYALHQGLAAIEEEGLERRLDRHRSVGERLVPGLERLGFCPLVTCDENRLWHLAVVTPPAQVNEAVLRQKLLDGYNIEIAGGLGQLAGKVLRIGAMGPLAGAEHIEYLLDAIAASI